MIYFAQLNDNSIVTQVVCVDDSATETYKNKSGFIQTYNNGSKKHFAGIGFFYNPEIKEFIPPKLFKSWVLNDETLVYEPPSEPPSDGEKYKWDEDSENWVPLD